MDVFKFKLNEIVKDKVTGFEGVVMGRTEYNTGCIQYGICPQSLTSDGKLPEWFWLDGSRLVATGKMLEIEKESGGPHPAAPTV